MFKVQPVRSKELQSELCKKLQCEYISDAYAFFAAEMNEDGSQVLSVFGICQFVLDPTESVIKSIAWDESHENDEAITIMVRAVMSFCHRAEVKSISVDPSAASEFTIKSWGFRNTDGKWSIDLNKFYISPCHYNDKQ